MVSNTVLQLKEPEFLGEIADSSTWAGNIQDKPRVSYSARKIGSPLKKTNNDVGISKRHKNQLKELPMTQARRILAIQQVVFYYKQKV